MYKLNQLPPTPPTLSDEQKVVIFNSGSLKSLMSGLNEKKGIEDMKKEKDLLVDSLIQKQARILNKIQLLDEKAETYKLAEGGETINDLLNVFENIETQIDESLESFTKADAVVSGALKNMHKQVVEYMESLYE